jgi:hypothetical protein
MQRAHTIRIAVEDIVLQAGSLNLEYLEFLYHKQTGLRRISSVMPLTYQMTKT